MDVLEILKLYLTMETIEALGNLIPDDIEEEGGLEITIMIGSDGALNGVNID